MVVENKPGAAGRLAAELVKVGPSNGSAIPLTPASAMTVYPFVYRNLAYDPQRDFTPVAMACSFDFVIAVGPKVPSRVRSIVDFVGWCKANPGEAAYASAAMGSLVYFVRTMFVRLMMREWRI